MNSESDDKFFERFNWARTHGAFNDHRGSRIQRGLSILPHDKLLRSLAESRIHYLEQQRKAGRIPPFVQAQMLDGELVLGQDLHGSPIRIMLDWLCSGLLTIASTGAGKSNLVFWLLSQFACLAPSVFLFEPYKLQCRLLLPVFRRVGKPLIVLPWQHWRWNLLQCAGCDPGQHAATAVDLLVRTLNLPGRAAAILRQGIYALYGKFGVWDQDPARFPTLFHLFEWTRAQTNLNSASREAILDRLGAFLLSLTPACGAWTRCWSPADLSRYSIIWEMRGASESVRNLLPQSLLFSIFNTRIAQGLVNTPLELLLVFEDAARVFSDRTTAEGEVTPLDEATGIVRGAGLGIWPIAQSTVGFSRRTRPNMAIRIFGRLGCHEDYLTLGADCGLNAEQLDYVRHRLVPGMFVGQVGIGSHTLPFLFRVPLARLPTGPSDAEVEESQAPLRELPTEFADEFAKWTPQLVVEVSPPATEKAPVLSEADFRLLRAVVEHPGQSITFYCRQTRLSGKRLAEARKHLVDRGFVREHPVALRARGRTAIVIEPLEPAAQALRDTPEAKV
jgi:hypothetical protein